MYLKKLFTNFITSGIGQFEDKSYELKYKLLNTISLAGIIATLSSFLYSVTTFDPFSIGFIQIVISTLLGISVIIALRLTKKIQPIIYIDLTISTIAIIFAAYSSGEMNISLVWIYLLPPLYFFLTDKTTGRLLSLIPFGSLTAFILLQSSGLIQTTFAIPQLIEATLAYVTISLLMFVYAVLIDSKQKSLDEKRTILEDTVKNLDSRNKELEYVQTQLTKSNKSLNEQLYEIQRLNELMVNRELKMAEMKKQMKELTGKTQ